MSPGTVPEAATTHGSVPLSVLDFVPVAHGSSPGQALRSTLELARHAERLGYRRYWVAEHHGMPAIASSSPPVLIAHLASCTTTIRVGSGGVMLPNHAPLVIAEQFGMLEALHPGRVDLGLGRAPGTDERTGQALRRPAGWNLQADDFPAQLKELIWFFTGRFPEQHPYRGITAVPGLGCQPPLFLLGSSTYSAQCAALLGLPFAFAYHFSAPQAAPAISAYRSRFRAVGDLARPYVIVAVSVVCADSDEAARLLAGPSALAFLRVKSGRARTLPTAAEAGSYPFSAEERTTAEQWTEAQVVGDPDQVRRQLVALAERTGADELMITTLMDGHADRVHSYELIAEALLGVGARSGGMIAQPPGGTPSR